MILADILKDTNYKLTQFSIDKINESEHLLETAERTVEIAIEQIKSKC